MFYVIFYLSNYFILNQLANLPKKYSLLCINLFYFKTDIYHKNA